MANYTVAIRERGKSGPWLFVTENLDVTDTATRCKPLTKDEATAAKAMFVDGAAKAGRPVVCRIVRLAV